MNGPLAEPHASDLPPLERARVAPVYAQAAAEAARGQGLDMARLGAACGLPGLAAGLGDDVPVTAYLALLDAAARLLGDPSFGLRVGEHHRVSTFAGYGLLLCTCATFREAAEQTLRLESLTHDLGRSEIGVRDGVGYYRWHSPWLALPGGPPLAESVAAGVYGFCCWLASERLPLVDVSFVHPAPAGVLPEVYRSVFGAPVRFQAEVTEARFPAEVLDRPITNADTSMGAVLGPVVESMLAARRHESAERPIAQAARERIRVALMRGTVRVAEVAAQLGITPRTLQRRLAEGGLTFKELLEDTRRGLALRYLRDRRLSVAEVALLLGFSEQSNFTHAFRGWFGTTPAAWRRRHRQ